jgi:hypothetical protein
MAKRMKGINTKETRDALRLLVRRLRNIDLKALDDLVKERVKARRKSKATNAREWVAILAATAQEIEEWCPDKRGDNPFTIDVPPKRRRR